MELLRNGGRATSTDESASPLALAASGLREDMVRGLCGLPQVATFDCVVALRRIWTTRCHTVAAQRSSASICLSLCKKLIPTDCQLHFTEILHATASLRMFDAVEVLLEKLQQLPVDARQRVLQSLHLRHR